MTEVAQEQPQGVSLHYQDLDGVVKIIDLAAQRGAFRGEELSVVGGYRDKVAAFIQQVAPQAHQQVGEAEPQVEEQVEAAPKARKTTKAKA